MFVCTFLANSFPWRNINRRIEYCYIMHVDIIQHSGMCFNIHVIHMQHHAELRKVEMQHHAELRKVEMNLFYVSTDTCHKNSMIGSIYCNAAAVPMYRLLIYRRSYGDNATHCSSRRRDGISGTVTATATQLAAVHYERSLRRYDSRYSHNYKQ